MNTIHILGGVKTQTRQRHSDSETLDDKPNSLFAAYFGSSASWLLAISLIFTLAAPISAFAEAEPEMVVTVAGMTLDIGDNGPANQALMGKPAGLCIDGNLLYISDFTRHQLRKVDLNTNVIDTTVGFLGSGTLDGPAATAQLVNPFNIICKNNAIYISERNAPIRKLDLSTPDNTVSSVYGNGALSTAECVTRYSQYLGRIDDSVDDRCDARDINVGNTTFGIDVDNDGRIFFMDSFNGADVLWKVEPSLDGLSQKLSLVVGGGGYLNIGNTKLDAVCNAGGTPPNNALCATIPIIGLNLSFAPNGDLYYSDVFNINKIDKGADGIVDGTDSISEVIPTLFSAGTSAVYLHVSNNGTVYYSDFFASTAHVIVNGVPHLIADESVLSNPGDIITHSDTSGDRIFIASFNANRVLASNLPLDPSMASGYTWSTIAGGLEPEVGDGRVATTSVLVAPQGVAKDNNGNLYISDTGRPSIRKVDANTGIITTMNITFEHNGNDLGIDAPYNVDLDHSGNLYIVDNPGNRVWTISNTDLNDGDGIYTASLFAGGEDPPYFCEPNCIATETALVRPEGIAFSDNDGDGVTDDVFIADRHGYSIKKVTNGVMSTVAGLLTPNGGFGELGFGGDGIPASSSKISGPHGLAVDNQGNIFWADQENRRIRMVDVDSANPLNIITGDDLIFTLAGTGVGGYSGDSGPALEALLQSGTDVDYGTDGNLYITDQAYRHIRQITPGANGFEGNQGGVTSRADEIINTVIGAGGPTFNGSGLPPLETNIQAFTITIDAAGTIYLDDFGYNRIRRVDVAADVKILPTNIVEGSNQNKVTLEVKLPPNRNVSTVNLNSLKLQGLDNCGELRVAGGPTDAGLGTEKCQLPNLYNFIKANSDVPGFAVVPLELEPNKLAKAVSGSNKILVEFDKDEINNWINDMNGNNLPSLHLRVTGKFYPEGNSNVGRHFSGDVEIPVK